MDDVTVQLALDEEYTETQEAELLEHWSGQNCVDFLSMVLGSKSVSLCSQSSGGWLRRVFLREKRIGSYVSFLWSLKRMSHVIEEARVKSD